MDLHAEMLLEEYKENLETFEIIKKIVLEQLNMYVKNFGSIVNSVEARIKTEKSLAGKLELKGDKYQTIFDITDLVGARVVTFYNDEVDKFAAQVEKSFIIDWDNSIDKRKMYAVDQFGYMSLHYICSIPEKMYKDEAHPNVNKFKFEIQLRSNLQHTWATIYHDTGYKNDVEVPREYLRNLSRLAGLLELADDKFVEIRTSLDDYRRRVKQVVKSGDFSKVELNIDSFNAYLDNGGFKDLNKKIATINNMEIEEISLRNFLVVFKNMGFATLKQLDDMTKQYSDMAYEFAIRQFTGKDIDIISNATGPLYLCVVYVLSNDMGEHVVKRILDRVYGERKSNVNQARRLTNIGKSMGLVKGIEEQNG
ncbi:MAG: (p)ppGpp synthetase [Bacilli bacterium]|nr:(p)ppGpp synthetase [Bacilli bacterium]